MAFRTHSHRTQRKPLCSAKHHADRNGGVLPEAKNHRGSEPRPSNRNTNAPHARQHSRRRPDLHHSQLGRSSAAPLDALGRKPPPPTAAAPLHLHAPEPAAGTSAELHAAPARTRCRPCTAQIGPAAPPRAPRTVPCTAATPRCTREPRSRSHLATARRSAARDQPPPRHADPEQVNQREERSSPPRVHEDQVPPPPATSELCPVACAGGGEGMRRVEGDRRRWMGFPPEPPLGGDAGDFLVITIVLSF
nr:WAS/WASL-interacting protein family member 2 [Aegilops tauschii subsp. strangulata]